jgi:ketosteroid isomerase-like protein
MKQIALAPFLLLFFVSCKMPPANDCILTNEADKVLQTDRNFNSFCHTHGVSAAFIAFAADSVIQMRDGAAPLIGLKALQNYYIQKNDTSSNLSWTPSRAKAQGMLGYTYGWWKFKAHTKAGADTLYMGTYVTVWEKQNNGDWKYVLDGGNNAPAPLP